jgi:hypothetical protein
MASIQTLINGGCKKTANVPRGTFAVSVYYLIQRGNENVECVDSIEKLSLSDVSNK